MAWEVLSRSCKMYRDDDRHECVRQQWSIARFNCRRKFVMTSNTPSSPLIFATRAQVTAALVRAAERARVLAEQTGTKLVVVAPAPKANTGPLKPQ